MVHLAPKLKGRICQSLLRYDPEIVEIVQFGSSIYAPRYAKDVDLLVITKEGKDYGGYLDSLDGLELPFNVDVVVKGVKDRLKSGFACQVLGAFKVLYGNGRYLAEITEKFDPSFEEAYAVTRAAKRYLEDAKEVSERGVKDVHIRNAFNSLFHASRIAAMAFLSTENARWGGIKRNLPQPYRKEFEEFINILHLKYFYDGDYPEEFEEEFKRWNKRVEDFVEELEKKRL